MFAANYFAPFYWADRYFSRGGGTATIPVVKPTVSIGPIPSTGGGVRVTWTDSEAGVTSYDIEHNGAVTTGVTSPQDYVIADLTTVHAWRVRGVNSAGNGPWSDYAYLGSSASTGNVIGIVLGDGIIKFISVSTSPLTATGIALDLGTVFLFGPITGGSIVTVINTGKRVFISPDLTYGTILS